MLGYQHILEVIHSLQAHKIRTIFTGFGVMWAMLILVLLQGAGTGLYNGMIKKFRGYIGRTLSIYPGYSAVSEIELTESLSDDLANHLTIFEQVIPVFQKTTSLSYGEVPYKGSVIGVGLGYEQIGNLALVEGRFFTERDLAARLPVCILGLHKKEQIFGSQPAIGQFITIEGNMVCVIGVLKDTTGVDNKRIIIPSSLFKALFPTHAQSIDHITSTLTPRQSPIQAKAKVRAYLARRLGFALEDRDALYIYSSNQARIFQLLFTAMQAVIWLVSLCFLISGVVGVGNMMLVVVKDRTQELAIRKVIGAQASDIIGLVVMESIVINLIAGIFGLGIGMAVLRWINTYLVPIMANHGIARFEFQSSMILAALVILVLSGGFAGIIPAKRALCIKPVDALNN